MTNFLQATTFKRYCYFSIVNKSKFGAGLLSDVSRVLTLSFDNLLDFHEKALSLAK